jgi:hypothetical protein
MGFAKHLHDGERLVAHAALIPPLLSREPQDEFLEALHRLLILQDDRPVGLVSGLIPHPIASDEARALPGQRDDLLVQRPPRAYSWLLVPNSRSHPSDCAKPLR